MAVTKIKGLPVRTGRERDLENLFLGNLIVSTPAAEDLFSQMQAEMWAHPYINSDSNIVPIPIQISPEEMEKLHIKYENMCLCCMWFKKNYAECADKFEISIPFWEMKDKNNLPQILYFELIL